MERSGDNAMTDSRMNIFDLDRASLERFFEEELGEKKFRAHQVMKWIHHRYATSFEEMTDLGKALRSRLEERAVAPTTKRLAARQFMPKAALNLGERANSWPSTPEFA